MGRLIGAEGVDTDKSLSFSFNGRGFRGLDGDTLASALLANDVDVVSRSLKFHRPRGILGAGEEETHAIVALEGESARAPNVMATQVRLLEGLSAATQNAWPSARFDLLTVLNCLRALMPAGFYYKTFMWPNWHWYEPLIRRMAGFGRLAIAAPGDRYSKRYAHCETLIVGAGPAGLAAALALKARGERVIVLDAGPNLGGTLRWEREIVDGVPGHEWLARVAEELGRCSNVKLLRRTTALGYYDHNLVSAVEHHPTGSPLRSRLWRIRAGRLLLASGAHERPMIFPDNDRPGIMLAAAVRRYLNEYGVLAGRRAVIYTNNDSAYRTALDLNRAGTLVAAVVDVRAHANSAWVDEAKRAGIEVMNGHALVATAGRRRVRRVTVAPLDSEGRPQIKSARHIECDLVAMSGGWSPAVHLWSQAGGALKYSDEDVCILPDRPLPSVAIVGAANGSFALDRCLAEGAAYGGGKGYKAQTTPEDKTLPFWYVRGVAENRQFVDFLHDVTVRDIAVAVREGFTSVEHLKRYTTVGMSFDQGKTSNVNALAILASMTAQPVGRVGATRFRPPYEPVAMGPLAGNLVDGLATRYRRLPVSRHAENGGVLEDHGGWLRAAYYRCSGESEQEAIHREVDTARHGAVLFDSSSLGKIEVRGRDAAEFLSRVYVNNVKSLPVGRVRYGLMLNEQGGIVDDGVFARLASYEYLVTTSSSGALSTAHRLERYLQCEWPELDVTLTPVTNQWATLALSGPKARGVLQRCALHLASKPTDLRYLHVVCGTIEGIPLRLFRVSFTGEDCFELNVPADFADALWGHLMHLGRNEGIAALGMEALNILRIEKGFLEVGVDTDADTTPLDVGWGSQVANRNSDFVGGRSLSLPAARYPNRPQLVGFVSDDRELPIAVGTHLLSDNQVLGHITSSCMSPTLRRVVGMALVRGGVSRLGTHLEADVRGRRHPVLLGPRAHYDPQGDRLHD